MADFDMKKIADNVKRFFEKEKKEPDLAMRVSLGSNLSDAMDGPCVLMPDWWAEATNTKGLYFGRMTMIAGDSDSGKTSAAIIAMKAALDQGYGVIYIETEGKTTTQDLLNWGVDPDKILLASSSIAEEAFEAMFALWDQFIKLYPDAKFLVIYDSIGNTVSLRDANMDLLVDHQKPGGKGAINRLALNKMVAKMNSDNAAVLVINYTYDNIGSPGKTNAGGKAVNFFSSMTYQTTRKQWLEKQVDGKKVRIGAIVKWTLFKNHINKQSPGMKEFFLKITSDGISLVGGASDDE